MLLRPDLLVTSRVFNPELFNYCSEFVYFKCDLRPFMMKTLVQESRLSADRGRMQSRVFFYPWIALIIQRIDFTMHPWID